MKPRFARESAAILWMLVMGFIGVLGGYDAIRTGSVPSAMVSMVLLVAAAFLIYERTFPLGARILYRGRADLVVPGNTRVIVQPASIYKRGRLWIIFDKSIGLFNGTVQVEVEGHQLAAKTLPVVRQWGVKLLGAYNRDLLRDSDRVFLDVDNETGEPVELSVELSLAHNVTDLRLKRQLNINDVVEAEVILKGR